MELGYTQLFFRAVSLALEKREVRDIILWGNVNYGAYLLQIWKGFTLQFREATNKVYLTQNKGLLRKVFGVRVVEVEKGMHF